MRTNKNFQKTSIIYVKNFYLLTYGELEILTVKNILELKEVEMELSNQDWTTF